MFLNVLYAWYKIHVFSNILNLLELPIYSYYKGRYMYYAYYVTGNNVILSDQWEPRIKKNLNITLMFF